MPRAGSNISKYVMTIDEVIMLISLNYERLPRKKKAATRLF